MKRAFITNLIVGLVTIGILVTIVTIAYGFISDQILKKNIGRQFFYAAHIVNSLFYLINGTCCVYRLQRLVGWMGWYLISKHSSHMLS